MAHRAVRKIESLEGYDPDTRIADSVESRGLSLHTALDPGQPCNDRTRQRVAPKSRESTSFQPTETGTAMRSFNPMRVQRRQFLQVAGGLVAGALSEQLTRTDEWLQRLDRLEKPGVPPAL